MTVIRTREPGEPTIVPNGDASIVFIGKIGAMVKYPVLVDFGEGYVEKIFEKFVRPPGTRIIAVRDGKIFFNKERRLELDGFDWRLPGGKVFDSFAEFEPYVSSEVPEEAVLSGARLELHEEAHMRAANMEVFTKTACGATVTWDLYYIIATDISEEVSTHKEGEEIIDAQWFSFEEIGKMCKTGEIGEGRTVSALLRYIESKK